MRRNIFLFVPCLVSLLAATFAAFAPSAGAASITDSEQRTIEFSQPFKRIISLYPGHTTNLLDLGLNQEIIACNTNEARLPDRPVIQYDEDPERLLALKPDMVLVRPMVSRAYPDLVSILEKNNVRVVSLQPTNAAELFAYWLTLGKLTGREQQAQAMVETFNKKVAAIAESLQKIPQEKRKRVYFEAMHQQMKTFAANSIAMFVLESAGGINIATDAKRMRETNIAAYGKEHILAKAGQIDVYLAEHGRMNPVSVEDIVNESGFEVIKAVRDKQVFLVDEKMVSRPTMELLDGIRFVHSLLYPESAF